MAIEKRRLKSISEPIQHPTKRSGRHKSMASIKLLKAISSDEIDKSVILRNLLGGR